MPQPITTVEEFYAHAIAIEREAAERYGEFADWFDMRSAELAALCRRLATLEREHFDELTRSCAQLRLPYVAPGEYRWLERDAPETAAREFFYRVTTSRQLLEIALDAEKRAHAFFVWIARTAPAKPVRELAAIMAAEENEHVAWVTRALENVSSLT